MIEYIEFMLRSNQVSKDKAHIEIGILKHERIFEEHAIEPEHSVRPVIAQFITDILSTNSDQAYQHTDFSSCKHNNMQNKSLGTRKQIFLQSPVLPDTPFLAGAAVPLSSLPVDCAVIHRRRTW